MGLPVRKLYTVCIPPCAAVTGFSRDDAIDGTHTAHYAVLRRFLCRFKAALRYPCVQSRGYRFQEGFRFIFLAVFGKAVIDGYLFVGHGFIGISIPCEITFFCPYACGKLRRSANVHLRLLVLIVLVQCRCLGKACYSRLVLCVPLGETGLIKLVLQLVGLVRWRTVVLLVYAAFLGNIIVIFLFCLLCGRIGFFYTFLGRSVILVEQGLCCGFCVGFAGIPGAALAPGNAKCLVFTVAMFLDVARCRVIFRCVFCRLDISVYA